MVHQLDHFQDELLRIADDMIQIASTSESSSFGTQFSHSLIGKYVHPTTLPPIASSSTTTATSVHDIVSNNSPNSGGEAKQQNQYVDRAWQAISVTQCLFDCKGSIEFNKH